MSIIWENCSSVDSSDSLVESPGGDGVLYQEVVGNSDDAPGCGNNEKSKERLVSGGNELFVEDAVDGTEALILRDLEDLVDICCDDSRSSKAESEAEHELVVEGVVCHYGSNGDFCSALGDLLGLVLNKFAAYDIREDEYKRKNSFLSIMGGDSANCAKEARAYPSLKETVDNILCVAVTTVIGEDVVGDFLLKASAVVRNYFSSRLGISCEKLSSILLDSELSLLVGSGESANKSSSSPEVNLLKSIADKCCSFDNSWNCGDIKSRPGLNPWSMALFLRSIIALLVLFPESLQPIIVRRKGLST
ncbi:hypothetical protein [Candidatus Ichthyocystis hellenicum]|uniref:hypothetical protein n=1 Tax=Candidatus Ichthyocystis hellenicum TaxID=1561003 RepID=UPI000B8A142A|nr:hypothetical protein [Candidatus Ichthyocystis hellenicum]